MSAIPHGTTSRINELIYSNTYVRAAQDALRDLSMSPYARNHAISLVAIAACAGVLTEEDTLLAVETVREWWRQLAERAVS